MAKYLDYSGLSHYDTKIKNYIDTEDAKKQDLLVSGTNIKKLENIDILGSGTINVKTINNESILGSGNIGVSKLLYDDQSGIITLDDGKNDVTIQLNQDNTFLNIDATAVDDRGQIQQIINMNLADKQYVDDEVSPKQGQILKTQSGLEADVLIQGTQNFDTVLLADETYVDNKTAQATETTLGTIKLNPNESVDVNANGQLTVGGRLGQFPNGGVFYPTTIEPTNVGSSTFLMSDGAKNLSLGSRQFGIMAGAGLTCKSASAGATQYRLSNTQGNRFTCFAAKGGRLAIDQTDAQTNGTALITDISFANGSPISAYFGPTESSNDIIITVDRTVNPSASTTKLRIYGTSTSNDVIVVGQGCGASGGKAISLGQSCFVGGNQCIAFGNSSISTGNNSVAFGHTHLVNKQFCFAAGQGHDFTNGGNGAGAVGIASEISSNTAFAVGNGTFNSNGNITRSNAFEVLNDGSIVLKSPNGTRWKITVDNSGNLTTTAI